MFGLGMRWWCYRKCQSGWHASLRNTRHVRNPLLLGPFSRLATHKLPASLRRCCGGLRSPSLMCHFDGPIDLSPH